MDEEIVLVGTQPTWRSALVEQGPDDPVVQHLGLVLNLYFPEKGQPWQRVSLADLAKAMRRDRTTVARKAKVLEDAGWIERRKGGSGKGQRRDRTQYRLTLPDGLSYFDQWQVATSGTAPLVDQWHTATRTSGTVPPSTRVRVGATDSDSVSKPLGEGDEAGGQIEDPDALFPSSQDLPTQNGNGRVRDEMFEAVVFACGWDLDSLTRDERGRANAAAKQLREVHARPGLVRGFPDVWQERYGDTPVTPQAITRNWSDYASGKLYRVGR